MKLKTSFVIFFFLIVFSSPFFSFSSKKIKVYKTDSEIILDGVLDEKFWSECELIDNFFQQFPDDSIQSNLITEVRIAYTDQRIFLSGNYTNFIISKGCPLIKWCQMKLKLFPNPEIPLFSWGAFP